MLAMLPAKVVACAEVTKHIHKARRQGIRFLLLLGPLLLGWRPSLLGWRPSLLGWRPFGHSYYIPFAATLETVSLACWSACLASASTLATSALMVFSFSSASCTSRHVSCLEFEAPVASRTVWQPPKALSSSLRME